MSHNHKSPDLGLTEKNTAFARAVVLDVRRDKTMGDHYQDTFGGNMTRASYSCCASRLWKSPPIQAYAEKLREEMRERFMVTVESLIAELEEATKDNDGLHFQIALNYGGRDEIVRAVKKTCEKVQAGELKIDDINQELFGEMLDTHGLPEPDLLIRTCNEQRISNFLLWQLAYTEFYFTEVPWPDFSKEELIRAVEAYNHRDRRFGLVKEE